MRRDSQPRLLFNRLFTQIHILLWTRIQNININPLVLPSSNIRRHDNKRVRVCLVPYAFVSRVLCRFQVEFNSVCS